MALHPIELTLYEDLALIFNSPTSNGVMSTPRYLQV